MVPFVLGDEEVVLGFSLIGIKGLVPLGPEEAAREFSKVLEDAGGVQHAEPLLLLVTEQVAQWLTPEIRNAVLAGAFVQVIPGPTGSGTHKEAEALLLSALGIKL